MGKQFVGKLLTLASFLCAGHGRAGDFPENSSNLYFGAVSREVLTGDWYQRKDTGASIRYHSFLVEITPEQLAAGGGAIDITVVDLDSTGSAPPDDSNSTYDYNRAEWRNYFTGAVLQTSVLNSTESEVDYTDRTYTATAAGVYEVRINSGRFFVDGTTTVAVNDDRNFFYLRVEQSGGATGGLNAFVQGMPEKRTTGNITFYTIPPVGATYLNFRTFDSDGGFSAVTYTKPSAATVSGTGSPSNLWNGSGATINSGRDQVSVSTTNSGTPDLGVWQMTFDSWNSLDSAVVRVESSLSADAPIPVYTEIPTRAGQPVISAATTRSTKIGTFVDHSFTVTNNFFLTDIIDITTSGTGANWTAQVLDGSNNALTDTDGNGVVDTGQLTPGAVVTLKLRVTPNSGAVGPDTTSVNAVSLLDKKVGVSDTTRSVIKTTYITDFSAAVSPSVTAASTNATLTFTITGANSSTLTGMNFTTTYPTNLVNSSPLTVGGTCTGVTHTATAGGSTFNVTAGTVPQSGSCTITVLVTSSVEGYYPVTPSSISTTEAPISAFTPSAAELLVATGCISQTGTHFWNNAATWSCGHVPLAGERVRIRTGSTVKVDVNTAAVEDVVIDTGGTLQGDGTGKILLINGTGSNDLYNDGTLDFTGATGAQGSSANAILKTSTAALDFNQTAANPSVWKFSRIDFSSLGATLANITALEFNGLSAPLTGVAASITGTLNATWTFSGSVGQAVTNTAIGWLATWTTGTTNIVSSNTNSTSGLNLGGAFTLSGDLTVATDGVLYTAGTITVNGGDFVVNAGGRVDLATASQMHVATNKTFAPTSTVRYFSGGSQTITAENYGHLHVWCAGTAAAGTINVAGDFYLNAFATYTGATNNPNVNIGGNFINDAGAGFTSGNGTYTFNGTAAQTLTGATTFRKVTINNTAAAPNKTLTLNNDLTIGNTAGDALTFTSGNIVTGANKVVISQNGTITGAAAGTGWVAGNLQRYVAAGASTVVWAVGSNGTVAPDNGYSPVSLTWTGVAAGGGNLIVSATFGDHPNISTAGVDSTFGVNRWYRLTTTGVTGTVLPTFTNYSATMTFLSQDIDSVANTSIMRLAKYTSSAWTLATAGTRTTTTNQGTGITTLGDFAIGEPAPCTYIGSGNWNLGAGSWSCGRVPIAGDTAVIPNGSTVTLNVTTPSLEAVRINTGGILQGDGTGKALTINGTNSNDLVNNGTLDFSGVVGAAGSSNAAGVTAATAGLDLTQTHGLSTTWKLSTINWSTFASTIANMTQLEFAGHLSPFVGTGVVTTASTVTTPLTWLFSGSTQQTITIANVTAMAGAATEAFSSTNAPATFRISNTHATGLLIEGTMTVASALTGSIIVDANAVLTLGSGTASATTTPMPTTTPANTYSFHETSTVRYAGEGTQTVAGPATYGHLLLTCTTCTSAARRQRALQGTIVIEGNFTMAVNTDYVATHNPSVTLKGNLTTAGNIFNIGSNALALNFGTKSPTPQAQTITGAVSFTGSGRTTFANTHPDGTILNPSARMTFPGPITVAANSTLTLPATGEGLPSTGIRTYDATSTLRYTGGTQSVTAGQTYGNIVLTGTGTKTMLTGTHTIAGNLTIESGITYDAPANPIVNLAGNLTYEGAAFNSGTGVFTFNGASSSTLTGAVSITNVTMNKTGAAPNKTLVLSDVTNPGNNHLTVSGTLTFTAGNIVTGTNQVIIPSTGTISGAASGTGWVAGNLQRFVAAGASTVLFPVGSNGSVTPNLAYSPASLAFTGVGAGGGSLIVKANEGVHPQLASSNLALDQGIERWWTTTVTGVTGTALPAFTDLDATLTFVSGDVADAATETTFRIDRYNGSSWTISDTGTRTTTTTEGLNMTALGDLAVGEVLPCTSDVGAQPWNDAATWSCGRVPTTGDDVVIASGSFVTLDVSSAVLDTVHIRSGGSLEGDGTGNILTIDVAGSLDLLNDGTLDLSGAVGAGGSKAAVLKTNAAGNLSVTQTLGVASVWKFSTIDFSGDAGASFENITEIEFNGHGSPIQSPNASISNSSGTACTYTFSGTVAQTLTSLHLVRLAGSTSRAFSSTTSAATLNVTNSSASGLTLEMDLTGTSSLSGELVVGESGVLTLGGTSIAMPTADVRTFHSTSTVIYGGTGAQAVVEATYGNLTLQGGNTKTMATGNHNIRGTLTIGSSTTYDGVAAAPVVNLGGNFVNNGTFNSGTGRFTLNGSVAQTLTGATTFGFLTLANTAAAPNKRLTLNNDITVTTLTFQSGNIVTGSNKVIIPSGGVIAGAKQSTGWVAGNLQKFIPAGNSTPTFEIGTNGTSLPDNAYASINFSFVGVDTGGGSLIVSTTAGDHPQIATSGLNSAKTVNRWYKTTVTGVTGTALPSFTSYDANFNFVTGDRDSGLNTAAVIVKRYNGSAWNGTTIGIRTTICTQATGMTTLEEFAIGEVPATGGTLSISKAVATLSDPHSVSFPKGIPGSLQEYTVLISNPGASVDNNTVIITDGIPADTMLFVNDINGSGSGPVRFINGATSSGLTYTFTSLSSTTDDVDFSDDSGSTWTYTPVPDGNGCDANVTNVRIKPQGTFATGGTPDPSFSLKFRVTVE